MTGFSAAARGVYLVSVAALFFATSVSATDAWLGVVFTRSVDEVVAETTARVASVEVRLGETVESGQTLLQLESPALGAERQSAAAAFAAAQSRVKEARVGVEDARRKLTRYEGAPNAFPAERIEDARRDVERSLAGLESAEAEVEQREAALAEVRRQLTALRLAARISGTVGGCWCEPGQRVVAGQSLLRVVGDGRRWIRFALSPSDAAEVAVGDRVVATTEEDGRFVATIRHLAPEIDAALGLVLVEGELEASAEVRTGAVVRVRPAPNAP